MNGHVADQIKGKHECSIHLFGKEADALLFCSTLFYELISHVSTSNLHMLAMISVYSKCIP